MTWNFEPKLVNMHLKSHDLQCHYRRLDVPKPTCMVPRSIHTTKAEMFWENKELILGTLALLILCQLQNTTLGSGTLQMITTGLNTHTETYTARMHDCRICSGGYVSGTHAAIRSADTQLVTAEQPYKDSTRQAPPVH